MPRPAPPAPRAARHRAATSAAAARTASGRVTMPVPPAAALTAGAAPGAWAFGGEVPSAAELNELWLNTDLLRQRDPMQGAAHEELAALHARAAEPAPAQAQVTFTKLDAQGRLPVPLCPVLDVRAWRLRARVVDPCAHMLATVSDLPAVGADLAQIWGMLGSIVSVARKALMVGRTAPSVTPTSQEDVCSDPRTATEGTSPYVRRRRTLCSSRSPVPCELVVSDRSPQTLGEQRLQQPPSRG
jgi:hypothetical protein